MPPSRYLLMQDRSPERKTQSNTQVLIQRWVPVLSGSARQRKLVLLTLALIVIVSISGFYGYRYYGPTPYRTLRLFVRGVNRGDFDGQYALFVKKESGGMPLLPKDELKSLLFEAMKPPFPEDMVLNMSEVDPEHHFENNIDGFVVRISQRGKGGVPTGRWPDYFEVAIQRADSGWGVRAFFTYHSYYRRTYGEKVASQFKTLYVQRAYRLGLWETDVSHGK